MQQNNGYGRVENYTDAFLTTLGVFLFMTFWMIAATYGYIWVAVTVYLLDVVFHRVLSR